MSKLRATPGLALLALILAQGASARQADAGSLYRLWMPGESKDESFRQAVKALKNSRA